jgi:hypothetical protein
MLVFDVTLDGCWYVALVCCIYVRISFRLCLDSYLALCFRRNMYVSVELRMRLYRWSVSIAGVV